jgi:polyketide cyclase/dehydrase/lipid transport protein
MPEIRALSRALIPASPPTVYGLIADYHRGHPSILPPKYFENLTVEQGGVGAGTRISFQMRAFGTVRHVRAQITEPEPGRRLVETLSDSGIETEFTVEPVAGTQSSRVTIATRYRKPGPRGWLESLLAPRLLRTVYAAELRLLAERACAAPARRAPA